MRPAPRLARALLATLALLGGAGGLANGWTVQTVAVRDLREASSIAEDLVRLGFDAYTEFAMDAEGRQWVRVRVGCYDARPWAEALAAVLRGHVTADAAVVPHTPGAPARGCVERRIGFRSDTASSWEQPEPGAPTLVVEVAGVAGVLRFMDGAWRVLQEPATSALPPAVVAESRFRQASGTAGPFVRMAHQAADLHVCPGRLLASLDDAAIVEHGGLVSACVWVEPAAAGTAEAP